MTKLNDTQLILLSTAAQREDGSLMPVPETIGETTARVRKAFAVLIKETLAEEGNVEDSHLAWRQEGEANIGARITDAGRTAICATDDATEEQIPGQAIAETAAVTPKPTKALLVLQMLQREQGATLDELVATTRWLPHTTRAALTGLRKKGHAIDKSKRDDVTCYRLAGS